MHRRASVGEIVALTAALLLVGISFLPYWASLELVSGELISYVGPTRFSIWDAYPGVVLIAVGVAMVIFAVGVARSMAGKPSIRPSVLYVGGGAVVTLLLLYGMFHGPSRLLDDLFFEPGFLADGQVSFDVHRGPLLYVGLTAGLSILIGGLLALREGWQAEPLRSRQQPRSALGA